MTAAHNGIRTASVSSIGFLPPNITDQATETGDLALGSLFNNGKIPKNTSIYITRTPNGDGKQRDYLFLTNEN